MISMWCIFHRSLSVGNENINLLLAQYFPKSTDSSVYSQQKPSSVAGQLNE